MEITEGCHYMSNLSKLSDRMSTKYITGGTMEEWLNRVHFHITVEEDSAQGWVNKPWNDLDPCNAPTRRGEADDIKKHK